jgi:hypothetical protein
MTGDERLRILKEMVEAHIGHDGRIVGGVLFGNFAALGFLATMAKDSALHHSVFTFLALLAFLAGIGLGAFAVVWLSDDADKVRAKIIRLAYQEISSDDAVKLYDFVGSSTITIMILSCYALFSGVLLCIIGLAFS